MQNFYLKKILDTNQLQLIIQRLSAQIIESCNSLSEIILVGVQPRGVNLSQKIFKQISSQVKDKNIFHGQLDITFYRDDIRDNISMPNKTDIHFSIEKKTIILIDDVLFTGRTIRAALDALNDFGRADKIYLCVLIDRSFNRQIPIQADFIGKRIDTYFNEKVVVNWQINGEQEDVNLYEN